MRMKPSSTVRGRRACATSCSCRTPTVRPAPGTRRRRRRGRARDTAGRSWPGYEPWSACSNVTVAIRPSCVREWCRDRRLHRLVVGEHARWPTCFAASTSRAARSRPASLTTVSAVASGAMLASPTVFHFVWSASTMSCSAGSHERLVGVGLEQVRRGEAGALRHPVHAHEHLVEMQRRQRRHRDRADEGIGRRAHAAGEQHGEIGAARSRAAPRQMRIELVTTVRSAIDGERLDEAPGGGAGGQTDGRAGAHHRRRGERDGVLLVDLFASTWREAGLDGGGWRAAWPRRAPCSPAPRGSSRSRSRLIVMSLTPSCVVRSLTRADPWRCTWATINSRRRRARMRGLPVDRSRLTAGCGRPIRAPPCRVIIEHVTTEVNRFDHNRPSARAIAVVSGRNCVLSLDFASAAERK